MLFRSGGGGGEERRGAKETGQFGGEGGPRKQGTCVAWNHKGFGFIRPDDGKGDDLFCHATQISDGNCLEKDAKVEYEEVYDDRRSKYRAVEVSGGTEKEREYFGRDRDDDRRRDDRGGGYDHRGYDDDRGYDRDRRDSRGGSGYDDRRGPY